MQTIFRGSTGAHILHFTSADSSVSPAYSSVAPGSPNCRLLAMIGAAYQQEQTIPRTTLLQAATEFHEALERQRPLLPYRYSYQIGDGEMFGRGSGGFGGFHINGKSHSIWGGAGICYLQEMGVGPDGKGQVVNTIDLRGRKRIETDDFGTITIYRRKLKLALFEKIPLLVSFLHAATDEILRVVTMEDQPSIMDLVRLAEEGSGAKDWAEEQLYEMGEGGRATLIAKLRDPKAKKHHAMIVWILLTVFHSPESRQAVEKLMEEEQDDERKTAYLRLLAGASRQE